MHIERERTWLMKEFPEHLELMSQHLIHQTYLSHSPEVRVRAKYPEGVFKFGTKGDGTDKRVEVEPKIARDEYKTIFFNIIDQGRIIHKHFRVYELECGRILHISKVDGRWFYAEIEFPTTKEMNAYIAPDWFGEEITHSKHNVFAKMSRYSQSRHPESLQFIRILDNQVVAETGIDLKGIHYV